MIHLPPKDCDWGKSTVGPTWRQCGLPFNRSFWWQPALSSQIGRFRFAAYCTPNPDGVCSKGTESFGSLEPWPGTQPHVFRNRLKDALFWAQGESDPHAERSCFETAPGLNNPDLVVLFLLLLLPLGQGRPHGHWMFRIMTHEFHIVNPLSTLDTEYTNFAEFLALIGP